MNKLNSIWIIFALGVLFYLAFLIIFINLDYPIIGSDYFYFLPHMLDTKVHYINNGFSIQWFTPSFGGGIPAFPNPQNIQFSLPQLLVFWFNPWLANLISVSIYVIIGFWSCYRLGRDILGFSWQASTIGAFFFMINGFYIQHNAIGHLGYQMFPLIALFSYTLLLSGRNLWIRGFVLGLIVAIFIHGAGFYTLLIMGLSLLILVPMMYLIKRDCFDMKDNFTVICIGGILAFLLSFGKIYAIMNFMMHFPRVIQDNYYSNFFDSILALVMQLLAVPLFTIPMGISRDNAGTIEYLMKTYIGGGHYGIWEMDVSISPMLLVILLYQIQYFPRKLKKVICEKGWNQVLQFDYIFSLIALLLGIWITFEISSAQGIFFNLIHNLPFFRSLHVNIRFISSFILPLAMLGVFFYNREFSQLEPSRQLKVFSFFYAGTLLWLGVYFLLPNELQSRNFNLEQTLTDYQMAGKGKHFFVAEVMDVIDSQIFSNHATSLYPYEPIFGYINEEFLANLKPGSIYLEEDGYYNLTNPYSLVYDTDELFARFTLDQREMMEEFVNYKQPDWDIPEVQHILNRVSVGTFILIVGYGAYYIIWGRRRERKRSG